MTEMTDVSGTDPTVIADSAVPACVSVHTFHELLGLWAEDHVTAAHPGLYVTDCCGALVPLEQVQIARREHCLSASVAHGGEFVAGFLHVYRCLCPRCAEQVRQRPITAVPTDSLASYIEDLVTPLESNEEPADLPFPAATGADPADVHGVNVTPGDDNGWRGLV